MEIKNKIVLVTGASKGIGEATAILFAKQGATVIVHYNSDKASAKRIVGLCNKYSKGNREIQADLRSDSQIKEMFRWISQEFKKINVLVNNAGIFVDSENPNDPEVFDQLFQSNLLAHVRVTQEAVKLMSEGKIVNVSSVHGRLGHGNPKGIAYSALKAAMESYTKNLAKALAPKILVNAVAPGRTLTSMWGVLSPAEQKELGEGQLIERFIRPEEIADGILFLVRNDAICGEILTVDGGMSLKTLG